MGSHEIEIIKYVSEGGFAHVYTVKVDPPIAGHPVACLKRVAVPDKVYLNLLRAEVEAMQRLKGYSNVVQYFDSHAERMKSGMGYEVLLLMEYCAGGGLINFMNTRLRDQLKEHEVLKIMYDITLGLAHMHHLHPPLIHRDLKIENVLLTGDGTYKLCDFGSVSPVLRVPKTPQEYRILDDDIKHHTTVQYRSPEMVDVYSGYPIDEKSDIWALGVFLYKLCFYTTPFEREGNAAILKASYIIPQKPHYSDRLKNMIRVLLQPVPTQRPTAYQVMQEICAMREVDNPLARKARTPPAASVPPQISASGAPSPGPSSLHPKTSPGPSHKSYPGSPTPPTTAAAMQPVPVISLQPQPPYGAAQEILPMLSGMQLRQQYPQSMAAMSSSQLVPTDPIQAAPAQPVPVPIQQTNRHLWASHVNINAPIGSVPTSPELVDRSGSFETKFPVLSPTSPMLTGTSAFDFSEAEVTARFPSMAELEPLGSQTVLAQSKKPTPMPSAPVNNGPPVPRRPEELKARFVRETAQAQIKAAREEMDKVPQQDHQLPLVPPPPTARSVTPLGGEEWSWESEHRDQRRSSEVLKLDQRRPSGDLEREREYRTSRSSGEFDGVTSERLRKYRSSRSSGELEHAVRAQNLYASDSESDSESEVRVSEQATKLKKIIGGMTESTVVLENDNTHVTSSVDFLRTLRPHHHHVTGLVRQISKGGKAAHSRKKSLTNKLFRNSSHSHHRRSQYYGSDDDIEDDSSGDVVITSRQARSSSRDGARKSANSGLLFQSDMDGSATSEEISDGSDYEIVRRGSAVSVNSGAHRYNQPRSSIQHRVHTYLQSQDQQRSPRTAQGYGRYTDSGTHSDSEVLETTPQSEFVSAKKQMKRRTLTDNIQRPPLPPKANKPPLRKLEASSRTSDAERRASKPPKPAHLSRQSVVYP